MKRTSCELGVAELLGVTLPADVTGFQYITREYLKYLRSSDNAPVPGFTLRLPFAV